MIMPSFTDPPVPQRRFNSVAIQIKGLRGRMENGKAVDVESQIWFLVVVESVLSVKLFTNHWADLYSDLFKPHASRHSSCPIKL